MSEKLLFKTQNYSLFMCIASLIPAKRLFEIRALLHRAYIIEQKWQPGPNNPSGIKTETHTHPETGESTSVFVDRLDNESNVVWQYIVADSDEVCACMRMVFPDALGMYEVDYYNNAQKHPEMFELMNTWRKGRVVEMSRMAVDHHHRKRGLRVLIMLAGCEFAHANNFGSFTLISEGLPHMSDALLMTGATKAPCQPFKFEDHDQYGCIVLVVDYNNIEDILAKTLSAANIMKFENGLELQKQAFGASLSVIPHGVDLFKTSATSKL